MVHRSFSAAGRVQAGEYDTFLAPAGGYWEALPPVVYCHGDGQRGDILHSTEPSDVAITPLLQAVGDRLPMVVSDLGGEHAFGNDASQTRVGGCKTWIQAAGRSASGKVLLLAVSGGALSALPWAADNPTLVHGIVLIQPAIDLNDIHANNRGGVAAAIDTAYGGSYVDATERADHNPAYIAAQPGNGLQGLPIVVWDASDDDICLPSILATFAAQSGMDVTRHNLGAVGHTAAALAAVPIQTCVNTLLALAEAA